MNNLEAEIFVSRYAKAGSQRRLAAKLGLAQSTVAARFKAACALLGEQRINELMGWAPSTAPANRASAPISETVAPVAPGVSRATEDTRTARPQLQVIQGSRTASSTTSSPEVSEMDVLAEESRRLRAQLKNLSAQLLTEEQVKRKIFEIAHSKPTMPEWLTEEHSSTLNSLPGVPVLFGSDWHWGEVVNPSEIGGVNEYNLEIAQARLHKLIETAIDLLTNHMVNPQYPGIVFALGGDMVSGNIHEELSETNDAPIMPVVLDLVDHLYVAIKRLKSVFGKVFLPCVAGNHGRSTKKIRAKEFNFNSYDWLIYQQLDRLFSDDPDVVFYIPDGTDALVNIAGHRYCFSHGNAFRGGDGLIGPLGPVVRGDHKKRGRNSQVGQDYDTLVIGHFHQLLQMKRIIMNGSLIGYSEYAYANNFGYEPPQQALWVSHPTHGITFSMPVNVDEDYGRKKRRNALGDDKEPWVSFHNAKKKAR